MSNQKLQIGFIGGGNMARSIIGGLLEAGHDAGRLHIADPSPEQREVVQDLHTKLDVGDDNPAVAGQAEVLILAVKPQLIEAVITALKGVNRPAGQLLVSIAAGITLRTLRSALGTAQPIVRIMPNQPALTGAGMSVLIGSADTDLAHHKTAEYVAEAMGRAVWIEDEDLMDAVTAISGSGPAYFYLLMEIMEDCAKQMGLPEHLARTLTRQTGLGAGRVAAESDLHLAALRESVTSKGGTTAAALEVLERAKIRDIVAQALIAARDRSIELGAPGSAAGDSEENQGENSSH